MMKLGPVEFSNNKGLIVSGLGTSYFSRPSLPSEVLDSGFVGVPFLSESDAASISARIRRDVVLAPVIPSTNFDPIEDHDPYPEFPWARLLICDYRDCCDDAATVDGATGAALRGSLRNHPRVDPAKTAMVAVVGSRSWGQGGPVDHIARALGTTFREFGYDGIALDCPGSEPGPAAIAFAKELANMIPLLLISKGNDLPVDSPFLFGVRQA